MHTDTVGPASYNLGLSRRLARTARDYLLRQYPDLDADRVEAVGRGEEPPEGARAGNRVIFVTRREGDGSP